jgi:hypothetical protein
VTACAVACVDLAAAMDPRATSIVQSMALA